MAKLFSRTLQSKSGPILFAILAIYNLLLGVYLKDFLVLSPMLVTFYLLSTLPTLFFVIKIRSATMRAIVYIVLFFVLLISTLSFVLCRRLLSILTMIITAAEMMYLALFDESSGKDKPLTKIYVLAVSTLIMVMLLTLYNFVSKPETPYLLNGGTTLWDTQTEELADEICAGCDTDVEKVQAIYSWMIANLEYDYNYNAIFQYFNVRKTLSTKQGVCFDFSHLFAALCRSQSIPCYAVDGISYEDSTVQHIWNRVYYDGTWWNMDVTHDITGTAEGKELYGFRKLDGAFGPDEDFYIIKIY
jgi:hypothetical protein